jgi:hypothetical protein
MISNLKILDFSRMELTEDVKMLSVILLMTIGMDDESPKVYAWRYSIASKCPQLAPRSSSLCSFHAVHLLCERKSFDNT